MAATIERARSDDLPTVLQLLEQEGLPLDGASDLGDAMVNARDGERFFTRFGFERITRDDVPASVRASVEFTSACPASAVVMRRIGAER